MSEKDKLPKEFIKVIKDFSKDLLGTFPDKISKEKQELIFRITEEDEIDETVYVSVYEFCKEKYPKIFFDILYQNEELFEDPNKEVELLPELNFTELWHTDISVAIKATIWKYLQLILFSVISNIDSHESFGDTAKLFEAINQDEFKQKIEETIGEMENIFKGGGKGGGGEGGVEGGGEGGTEGTQDDSEAPGLFNQIPNAEDLHSHINQMMEGKLGCLAKEIAEETAQDFNIDPDNADSVNDIFKQLFKNPGKLMDLVKTVGTKLDTKLKSGDIKESELLEEASNLVNNMKNMPGMDSLEGMLSKMGMGGIPGMGKGGKMDMGALNRQMEQNLKSARMRDRMRAKLAAQADQNQASDVPQNIKATGDTIEGMEEFVFSLGDKAEKSTKPAKKKKKKPKGIKR